MSATLSMRNALDTLIEEEHWIELDELMFLLTCIRDNTPHDDVFNFLDKVIKNQ